MSHDVYWRKSLCTVSRFYVIHHEIILRLNQVSWRWNKGYNSIESGTHPGYDINMLYYAPDIKGQRPLLQWPFTLAHLLADGRLWRLVTINGMKAYLCLVGRDESPCLISNNQLRYLASIKFRVYIRVCNFWTNLTW